MRSELEPYYTLFVDVLEFTEVAQVALQGCSYINNLSYQLHHQIIDAFMQLMTLFVFVQL